MPRTEAQKESRLQTRVSRQQKAVLERAAELRGQSLTDFVIEAAQAAAEKVIQSHEIIVLTEKDRKVFFAALRRPPKPNAKLKAAAKRHRELIGEFE